jgi:hypothetical protein
VDARVKDLTPSGRPASLPHAMFAWCGISWGLVVAVILTVGHRSVLPDARTDPLLAEPCMV